MPATGRGFERRNRLFGAALHQQGAAEDIARLNIVALAPKQFSGDAFRLLRPAAVQRDSRPLQRLIVRHRSRQCEHIPAISISGLFGENPAAREDASSAVATAPLDASPTAPQRSQMRNTTRSSPA